MSELILAGGVIEAFKKLPPKLRYSLDTALVLFLITAVFQFGQLSDQVHKNTKVTEQVPELVLELAKQQQAMADQTAALTILNQRLERQQDWLMEQHIKLEKDGKR